ncbi:inosine monophosphate dehydrogenase [Parathielavia appendiculata]|uniref:Inosine monophosphate dehydrogenase n=1 Tax=Parathielavia appendiculata TaxID=2587402 RepID=A0AAN6TP75_9PEZI|nr:inosine monophosphate dehydrogenase [Parathielavia appendiculata]
MEDKLQSVGFRQRLAAAYPWTTAPLIVGAPMRVMSGPALAVAVSRAGGFGFIGPSEKPESTAADLETAKGLIASSGIPQPTGSALPVGVGYQIWNGDLDVSASTVSQYHPAAVWLFASRHGQADVDVWTKRLHEASPETEVWLQIGTLQEALDAVRSASPPNVLVVQGAEAGGHGRTSDGIGFITLLPEIADATRGSGIPLIAAGGVADGRGVVAALGIGAAGVAMGTRFLASHEARIIKGYQDEVVRATDGGANTVRTHLYNHLRGTFGWPEQFSPRTIINRSWKEKQAGTAFEEIKKRHDQAVAQGDAAWGPEGWTATYAGANVGLVRGVAKAGEIVEEARNEAARIIQALSGL